MADKYNFKIFKNDKEIFQTEHWVEAAIFKICLEFGKRTVKDSKRLASIGFEMYLKDDYPTPIGELGDFLAKKIKNIEVFEAATRRGQLEQFRDYLNENSEW